MFTETKVQFPLFGSQHFFILFLTAVILITITLASRPNPDGRVARGIRYTLATILLLNYIAYVIYRVAAGYWEIRYDLPMEFCNWSTFCCIIGLYTRRQIFFELAFFWVMAGSLQGIITPDLSVPFPHIYYFIFFISHCGIVIAALYFPLGLKMVPRKKSVLRVFLYSQIYFAAAFSISYLVDGNYGYMMGKPKNPSLLDVFGPWPYYLMTLQVLGVLSYIIIYAPFYFLRKAGKIDAT